MKWIIRSAASLGLVACLSATAAYAQPSPPAPTPTLWRFLGIPQAVDQTHSQLFNRRGNSPGLEQKPPLKNLADPSNLESEVPAIKAAAEIKQAEDLKPQKIKAIKYLAEMGCGCYDKDKKITKALIAAMEDCTEEVRLAAVQAIGETAEGECCSYCSERNCCNEMVTEQLTKLAYEMDENGCYLEPSERVRQAAAEALCICCPNVGPPMAVDDDLPLEGGETEPLEGAEDADNAAPTPPPIDSSILAPPPTDSVAVPPAWMQRPEPRAVTQYASSRRSVHRTTSSASLRSRSNVYGSVLLLDRRRNLAHVRFVEGTAAVEAGTRLDVYSRNADSPQWIGTLEVTKCYPESAHVRPVAGTQLSDIHSGDWVAVRRS